LRKLQYSIGFDVAARYRRLFDFYRKVAFEPEARWAAARLGKIAGNEGVSSGVLKK
jgi:hypothetical protein